MALKYVPLPATKSLPHTSATPAAAPNNRTRTRPAMVKQPAPAIKPDPRTDDPAPPAFPFPDGDDAVAEARATLFQLNFSHECTLYSSHVSHLPPSPNLLFLLPPPTNDPASFPPPRTSSSSSLLPPTTPPTPRTQPRPPPSPTATTPWPRHGYTATTIFHLNFTNNCSHRRLLLAHFVSPSPILFPLLIYNTPTHTHVSSGSAMSGSRSAARPYPTHQTVCVPPTGSTSFQLNF